MTTDHHNDRSDDMPDDMPDDMAEDKKAKAVLADVSRLRGSSCKTCRVVICGHEAVISIVLGYKNAPHCLACLAVAMQEVQHDLRDRVLEYILRRECFLQGWHFASREEQHDPTRPACLWPPIPNVTEDAQMTSGAEDRSGDPQVAAEWDAGGMSCGDLVLELRKKLMDLEADSVLLVRATDTSAPEDIPAWCGLTGHVLVQASHPQYWIRRRPA